MSDLTDARLDEIEERCKEATPGPWGVFNPAGFPNGTRFIAAPDAKNHHQGDGRCIALLTWADRPTGEFIAAAREDIPALVAEIRRLRGAAANNKEGYRQHIAGEQRRCRRADDALDEALGLLGDWSNVDGWPAIQECVERTDALLAKHGRGDGPDAS